MQTLLSTESLPWIQGDNTVELYLSDELPPLAECTAAYALVFKDGALLQTDLKEGERPMRQLDIPGGHIDTGETPEEAVIRETFEETGVRIQDPKLVAYFKITIYSEKPADFSYPYPTSYMLFYLAAIEEEVLFEGNDEVHGRVWLEPKAFETSMWCVANKLLLSEILKRIDYENQER